MLIHSWKGRLRLGVAASTLAIPLLLTSCGSDGGSETTASLSPSDCPAAAAKTHTYDAEPSPSIDVAKTYTAVMTTTKGTIEFVLDPKRAPITVNSFVFLAKKRYFDCIQFHRVVPGFVLQGGDPFTIDNSGPIGTGGPGYKFVDELPKANEYKFGSLAMANSGPNTNGSQFFIISGPEGEQLPPIYALFGQASKGDDVIKAIDALGVPNQDGPPSENVTILTVTIKES